MFFEPALDLGWTEADVFADPEARRPDALAAPCVDGLGRHAQVRGNVANGPKGFVHADRSFASVVAIPSRRASRSRTAD